jgi:hypothetical protein
MKLHVRGMRAVLPLMLAGVFASCRSIEGVDNSQLGQIDVSIVDQMNAPVAQARTTLEVGPNNIVVRNTNADGLLIFTLVPAGTGRLVYVDNPTGYTGGGKVNGKLVDVVHGEATAVKITLTKTP